MKRIAVLYGTTEGQTAKIAQKVAETIKDSGYDVTLSEIRELSDRVRLDAIDGVNRVATHAPSARTFPDVSGPTRFATDGVPGSEDSQYARWNQLWSTAHQSVSSSLWLSQSALVALHSGRHTGLTRSASAVVGA